MADRQRFTERFNFRGMNTALLADALPEGKHPIAINVRSFGDSAVRTRAGYSAVFHDSGAGGPGASLTDIQCYTTLSTDNRPRIIVHDSGGGLWLDNGVMRDKVGTGGLGASMIPFRPSASPQSWMYVCNGTGYRKLSAPNNANLTSAYKVGIAEPQNAPDACVDGFQYNEFTGPYTTSSWTADGTVVTGFVAGATGSSKRVNDTGGVVIADPASVSPATKTRYSVQVGTGIPYQIGETVTFSGGGSAVVEDIFPPIAAGAAITIQAIYYLSGATGTCIIVPSQIQIGANNAQMTDGIPTGGQTFLPGQISNLRRGSLIELNAEIVFVLSVTTGPQGQVAIETSTTGTHVIGETITGIPAIAVSGLTSTAASQSITAGQIVASAGGSALGTGWVQRSLSPNPFQQSLGTIGTPQEDDYVHISIAINNYSPVTSPYPVSSLLIMLNIDAADDGSLSGTAFEQNYLYYALAASTLAPVLSGTSTQLSAIQTQATQNQINALPVDTTGLLDVPATAPQPQGLTNAGLGQTTEIAIPITAFTRVGNDQSRTLANCNGARIQAVVAAACQISFASLWVGGGGQPDTTGSPSPYFYRVKPRSSLTGAPGNPSPETRYGVTPQRQRVIISLPSPSYDNQIDTWDIYRYGGTVTVANTQVVGSPWRYIGSAPANSGTFVDNVFDTAALAGQPAVFDDFEPWPSIDVPWQQSGGISVVGTSIVVLAASFPATITRWLPGTLMTLNGNIVATLRKRPVAVSGGYLFRTEESLGNPVIQSLVVTEPNVANQNLPYLWGPDANGVVFGCGDPLRPGALYSAKQYAPDTTTDSINDVTPPSEPLTGGEVIDGLALLASSRRWWMIQPAFGTAQRWQPVEIPAGVGLAAPFAHCTDGEFVYFVGKDGIYQMIPGLPAFNLTSADLWNLFPHGGTPGANYTYATYTVYAPDYSRVVQFRLTIANSILRFFYRDSTGTTRTLKLDMTIGSDGKKRMAWSVDQWNDPIVAAVQPQQPPGTLLTTGTAYAQLYFADNNGYVWQETDLNNDNTTAIPAFIATREANANDTRPSKQWLDLFMDSIPAAAGGIVPVAAGIAINALSQGSVVGSSPTIAQSSLRGLALRSLGAPVSNFLGLGIAWTDDFTKQSVATTLYEWAEEYVIQPLNIRSWQSIPTSHGLDGYHHIGRILFAYMTKGANPVTLTITAYDGTSPAAITLPATNGAYQKVEFIPTFNKGLLFTYNGLSADDWTPIPEDCEIMVGQWNRSGSYSVFRGLGGLESQ